MHYFLLASFIQKSMFDVIWSLIRFRIPVLLFWWIMSLILRIYVYVLSSTLKAWSPYTNFVHIFWIYETDMRQVYAIWTTYVRLIMILDFRFQGIKRCPCYPSFILVYAYNKWRWTHEWTYIITFRMCI